MSDGTAMIAAIYYYNNTTILLKIVQVIQASTSLHT
jgi:hypothetical protein